MLNHQTAERLREMKLQGMADGFLAQLQQVESQSMTFEERFGLLVDQELAYRHDRRLKRLLSEAKLRQSACLEDIDYSQPRGLDRALIRTLGTGLWLRTNKNVLITGPTGVGKTYLACALANAACRQGFRAKYYRVPRLLSELAIARADGTYTRDLAALARADLLVLDDWGLTPLNTTEGREILEVVEDRCLNRSTVIAGQLPVDSWHAAIGDPSVADAILDRLIHNSYHITLRGESMRRIKNSTAATEDSQ
jgi:DNA replication protein DnaC